MKLLNASIHGFGKFYQKTFSFHDGIHVIHGPNEAGKSTLHTFLGCMLFVILEFAIVARCIYVGMRTPNYMRRLICYGVASSMIFQVVINIGMAIGVMPVIGLTLPLVSYGGSSVISIYAMLGLVSGSYARPDHLSHERYVQPPRNVLY